MPSKRKRVLPPQEPPGRTTFFWTETKDDTLFIGLTCPSRGDVGRCLEREKEFVKTILASKEPKLVIFNKTLGFGDVWPFLESEILDLSQMTHLVHLEVKNCLFDIVFPPSLTFLDFRGFCHTHLDQMLPNLTHLIVHSDYWKNISFFPKLKTIEWYGDLPSRIRAEMSSLNLVIHED